MSESDAVGLAAVAERAKEHDDAHLREPTADTLPGWW